MKKPFELVAEIQEKDAEIERLKFLNKEERETIDDLSRLCIRAADALEAYDPIDDDVELIAELRKGAE